MPQSVEDLLFAFPDKPLAFKLPKETLAAVGSTTSPFSVRQSQVLYPRTFERSDYVCDSILGPKLNNWMEGGRSPEGSFDGINSMRLLLLDLSIVRSAFWLSSKHGDGFTDMKVALSAFMASNTFDFSDLKLSAKYGFPSAISVDPGFSWSSTRWIKLEDKERFCAAAILVDVQGPQWKADPSTLDFRVILVLTAPEIVSTDLLDAIAARAGTFTIDIDGDNNAKILASAVNEGSEGDLQHRATWWLVYMWRRMTGAGVRMGVLTTTEGTILLYVNDGVIQVTNRLPVGRGCIERPLDSTMPLLLAVQLLANDSLELPFEERGVGDIADRGFSTLWKLMDDTKPRLAGFHYPYGLYYGEQPPNKEEVVDRCLVHSMTAEGGSRQGTAISALETPSALIEACPFPSGGIGSC